MIFWTSLILVCILYLYCICIWSVFVFALFLGHPTYDILNGFGISLRLPLPPFYQSCGFYLRIYCSLIEPTFSYIFLGLFRIFIFQYLCIFFSNMSFFIFVVSLYMSIWVFPWQNTFSYVFLTSFSYIFVQAFFISLLKRLLI